MRRWEDESQLLSIIDVLIFMVYKALAEFFSVEYQ